MKGNGKSILIGAVVVAILIVLAAYKFFYSSDIEKAEKVQKEIDNLQVRIDELNAKNANRSMYDAGIANSQDIIDTVLSLYGPGNTPEKTIMTVVDLCNKTGVSVSDISFLTEKLVYSNNRAVDKKGKYTEEKVDLGGEIEPVDIYKSGMAIRISSGYTQMKKIMDYINSHPERMNAENFSTSFDPATGRLDITMNVNMFSVIDRNHEYVPPVVENIELATDNIFKTAELFVAEEETEEENAENQPTNNTTTNTETSNNGNTETSDDNNSSETEQ